MPIRYERKREENPIQPVQTPSKIRFYEPLALSFLVRNLIKVSSVFYLTSPPRGLIGKSTYFCHWYVDLFMAQCLGRERQRESLVGEKAVVKSWNAGAFGMRPEWM